jgi:hypothetical protein
MPVDDIPGNMVGVGVDFNKLREQSNLWIRRASIFMGIGANAAQIEPPVSHVLFDRAQYHFTAMTPTPEQARHFVDEFEVWVVANGLRELVEGHATFLDAVFDPFQLITKGTIRVAELQTLHAKFELNNVFEKRAQLFAALGITDHFEPMFTSLQVARNCLAHRNGIVGPRDVNTVEGQFELRWRFSGLKIRGQFVDLNAVPEGVRVEAGEAVQFGPVEKSRRFAVGSQLRLTRHELSEICFGFQIAAESVLEPLIGILREKGLLPPAAAAPEPQIVTAEQDTSGGGG